MVLKICDTCIFYAREIRYCVEDHNDYSTNPHHVSPSFSCPFWKENKEVEHISPHHIDW